ncbi:MAG: transcriptional regulator [Hyphomicrobiales bacterium]|nr:MAG: transcriptional regulator [Hyphomicrobiales bacterium]
MGEITNFRGETTDPLGDQSSDSGASELMVRAGQRVRKARDIKGIPRRELSEISGVSPRYLAQLEAGEGNISIGLLQRVAAALDTQIEWLVSKDDPWENEKLSFMKLYSRASFEAQQRALSQLIDGQNSEVKANRICLLGLRGAGKSTLGAMIGERMNIPFVELNREIEEQSGMPVNELIALYGHEGYRKLEARALERIIATHDTLILAVAGGIVAEPETYASLLNSFHTIWIKASPTEHMDRVRAQGDTRPMQNNPESMEQLKAILASRETMYSKAQTKLETSGKTVNESLNDLERILLQNGYVD